MKKSLIFKAVIAIISLAAGIAMAVCMKAPPKTFDTTQAINSSNQYILQDLLTNEISTDMYSFSGQGVNYYSYPGTGSDICMQAEYDGSSYVRGCMPDTDAHWHGEVTIKDGKAIQTGSLKIPMPSDFDLNDLEGMRFTWSLPATISGSSRLARLVTSYEQERDSRLFMMMIIAMAALLVLLITVVATPADIERKTSPFSSLATASLERLLFFFIGSAIFLSILTGLLVVIISGELFDAFLAPWPLAVMKLFAAVCFTLIFWLAAMAICWLKFVFLDGPAAYYRTHSSLYAGMKRGTERNVDAWFNADHMSAGIYVLYGCCLLLILTTGSASLALVMGLFLFAAIVFGRAYIKKSWDAINHQADLLAKGDFETEVSQDTGVFRPLSEKLDQIRSEYRISLEEAVASTSMKNELIANVSHDLKTPLTGLTSYADLLEKSDDPQAMKKYAAKIGQYSARLNDLVRDLFDVSKATSGDLVLEPVKLRMDQLVLEALDEQREAWEKRHLDPICDLQECSIRLDPDKTMRICENLFSNVAKYALENTRVFIELRQEGRTVCLTIKNVSAAPLNFSAEEITERFVRGDKSRHEIGSGLGLAIAKSFAEVQKGSFRIEIDGDLFKAIVTFTSGPDLPPLPETEKPDAE